VLDRWLPTVGLVLVAVLVTFHLATQRERANDVPYWMVDDLLGEVAPLRTRYGPGHNSTGYEEFLIRDFFQERRDGVFVDVGANHYQRGSNTYYLESALGWSGVAIEPQTEFAADYVRHRPRTRFIAMFASDTAGQNVRLFITPTQKAVASSTERFTEQWGRAIATTVPTTTLDVALAEAGVTKVDFVSMDIELHEPQALAGFDLRRFSPRLVCIEAHPDVRQQILDYFHARDYVVVAKYLRADVKNLYFQPAH
jgi:FkbM family methyltransferase